MRLIIIIISSPGFPAFILKRRKLLDGIQVEAEAKTLSQFSAQRVQGKLSPHSPSSADLANEESCSYD